MWLTYACYQEFIARVLRKNQRPFGGIQVRFHRYVLRISRAERVVSLSFVVIFYNSPLYRTWMDEQVSVSRPSLPSRRIRGLGAWANL